MTTKTKNLRSQIVDYQNKTAAIKPIPRQRSDPAPRILRAMERNEPLIAVREFSAGRKKLQKGDNFDYSGVNPDRVCLMAKQGLVMLEQEFKNAERYNKMFHELERVILPAYRAYEAARQAHARAVIPLAEIKAQLENAEVQAREALERFDAEEKKLADLVNDPELVDLFGRG